MGQRQKEQCPTCAEWEKKAASWLASPEASQRLNGSRELAQRLNTAAAQRDKLLSALHALRNAYQGDVGNWHQKYRPVIEQIEAVIAEVEGRTE